MVTQQQVLVQEGLLKQGGNMNLSGYKETYYYFSGMASTVARQSAFAGIALIWIFKTEKGSVISLPESLFTPVLFLVLCLVFDLLQYIVAAAI